MRRSGVRFPEAAPSFYIVGRYLPRSTTSAGACLVPVSPVQPFRQSLQVVVEQPRDAPVLSEHRAADHDERAPAPHAVAVVPATFDTLNAWADGTANTYPLVKLCAALGARIPTVAVPFAKHDLAGHPAWLASIAVLRYAGVRVIDPRSGPVGYAEPVESGTGDALTAAFSWAWVLNQLPYI
jgi:Flavoprotein